jgi:ElaB/YqjD/DUF883 family membrane-anchored ribosome-binding protein
LKGLLGTAVAHASVQFLLATILYRSIAMASVSRVPNRPDYLTGFGCRTDDVSDKEEMGLLDKAKDAASAVVEKVEDAASSVKEAARDAASFVGQRASDAASAVGQGVSTGAGYVRDTASEAADNLTSLIRKHPVPSLLVAFAIGLLISRAVRR